MIKDLEIHPKFAVLYPTLFGGAYRPSTFKTMYGGRDGIKSTQVAKALLLHGVDKQQRILCVRETMTSMRDSSIGTLEEWINRLELNNFYQVGKTEITGVNGTQFIFKGIRVEPESLKSLAKVDKVWIEEAAGVTRRSLDMLLATTVRWPGIEHWFTFNPENEDDPVYADYVLNWPKDNQSNIIIESSWRDNPWLSREAFELKDRMYAADFTNAEHVWGGKCRVVKVGAIFADKCVKQVFTPGSDWIGPYFGADFGFSIDPNVLVKCWMHDGCLWIEEEAFNLGIDNPLVPAAWQKVTGWWRYQVDPHSRRMLSSTVALPNVQIRCDSSRADTICELQKFGVPAVACEKWQGDFIADGIAALRSFQRIVIHERCKHMWGEAQKYSYEVDKANNVLSKPRDKYNHGWDAVRYAMEPVIKSARETEMQVVYDAVLENNVRMSPELDTADEPFFNVVGANW